MIYLDASAYGKLVVREAESEALRRWLGVRRDLASSQVAWVEVPRLALRRGGPEAVVRAERLLALSDRVPLDPEVEATAARLGPPTLRALDAIHLAAMLRLRPVMDAAVVYDQRLADAARALALPVVAPAPG